MFERFRQPFDSPERTPFFYIKTFIAGYVASAAYVQSNLGVANIYGTDTSLEVVKKWAYEKQYSTNRVFSKILSGGLRFSFYEICKKFYGATLGEQWGHKLRWINFGLAAATAEIVAVALSLPFDNVNILREKFLSIEQIEKLRTTTDQALLRQLLAQEPQAQKIYYKGYRQALLKNVPYTVISFTAFEILSELTYSQVLRKPKQQFNGTRQVLHSLINGSIVGGLYFGLSKALTRLNVPTVTCNQIALPFYVTSSALLFGMYNAVKIVLKSQTMGGTSY